MRRPSPQPGSKMAACPSPSSEAAPSLDAHCRGQTGMPESLGAMVPYSYPNSLSSFTLDPREGYVGEPFPRDLPPLASPQHTGISAFRLSLPSPSSPPLSGLCSRHGLWNPEPWGFLTELGWDKGRSTKDGGYDRSLPTPAWPVSSASDCGPLRGSPPPRQRPWGLPSGAHFLAPRALPTASAHCSSRALRKHPILSPPWEGGCIFVCHIHINFVTFWILEDVCNGRE